jgi:hypothetical protein
MRAVVERNYVRIMFNRGFDISGAELSSSAAMVSEYNPSRM